MGAVTRFESSPEGEQPSSGTHFSLSWLCERPEPGRMCKYPAGGQSVAARIIAQFLESGDPGSSSGSSHLMPLHPLIPTWIKRWIRILGFMGEDSISRDPQKYFAEVCFNGRRERDEEGKRRSEGQHLGGFPSKFVYSFPHSSACLSLRSRRCVYRSPVTYCCYVRCFGSLPPFRHLLISDISRVYISSFPSTSHPFTYTRYQALTISH